MNRSSKLVSSFRLDSQKSVYTRSLTSDETGGCHGCSTALTSLPPGAQDWGSASVAKPGEGLLHAQSGSFVSCRLGFSWLLRFSLDSSLQCGSHHPPGALLTCSKRFNRLFQHCAKTLRTVEKTERHQSKPAPPLIHRMEKSLILHS